MWAGGGAVAGLVVVTALPVVLASPDASIDLASLYYDAAVGDRTSFALDLVSLATPGVTGLGALSHTDDALRALNRIDNFTDAGRAVNTIENVSSSRHLLEYGVLSDLPKGHVFDFPRITVKPYEPKGVIIGQLERFSCVSTACKIALNNPNISEEAIRKLTMSETKGTRLENAIPALHAYGGKQYVFGENISFGELVESLKNGPAIVSVNTPVLRDFTNHVFTNHAIVIDEYKDLWFSIRDPMPDIKGSAYKIMQSDFFRYWVKGRAIIAVP